MATDAESEPEPPGRQPATMGERWPPFHEAGLRWHECLERAIRSLRHPRQPCLLSITNAIEMQIEEGADPATLHHLLNALIACAAAEGITMPDLGLPRDDVTRILAAVAPRPPETR